MFNLEQSIADWRKQMLAAGIQTPVPLEELESHLRDEIEQRVKLGSDEQQAFVKASQQMGTSHIIKTEFYKIEKAKELRAEKFNKISFFTSFGLISTFIVVCDVFKLGTFAQTSPAQQISGLLAVAVMVFAAGGGYFGQGHFPVILNTRKRTGVCIFGAGLMVLWWAIFFFAVLQRVDLSVDQLIIAILWGFIAPFGVLAGFLIGLERAAQSLPHGH